MKLKLILFLSLITYHLSLFATPVSAHVVIYDRNIGATLHVDPNDDPIAGSQASFFFDFKDKTNKFAPANCDCTFTISENGQQIFSQPLFQNNTNPSLSAASVFYTFPQKDVYQVKVVGKPFTQGQFQDFTLNYDIRVDRDLNQSATSGNTASAAATILPLALHHLIIYLGAGILTLLLIAFAIFEMISRKKKTAPIAPPAAPTPPAAPPPPPNPTNQNPPGPKNV